MTISQEQKVHGWFSGGEYPAWGGGRVIGTGLLRLIIPVLFVITASQLTRAKGPQWLPYTFENPYAYLFNSLLLVDGQAPEHIDHPGPPPRFLALS